MPGRSFSRRYSHPLACLSTEETELREQKQTTVEDVARKYQVMAAPPNIGVEKTAGRSQQLSMYHATKYG